MITREMLQAEPRERELRNPLVNLFEQQKARFISREGGSDRAREKWDKYMGWAYNYTIQYGLSRWNRAEDIDKTALHHASEIAENFIGKGSQHFMVVCMDGRNLPAIMLSHVPHMGGVMRTQAGEIFGIQEVGDNPNGPVDIDNTSFKVASIRGILKRNKGQKIHYSFDSHLGCAAREASESTTGRPIHDKGLKQDIKRKLVLARGVNQIREEEAAKDPNVAEVFPQFFSYNPEDGTMYMGLEANVDAVEEFTPEALEKLRKEKRVVSTWDFLLNKKIAAVLEKEVSSVDFRTQFAESMFSNWQAIEKLYDKGNGGVFTTIHNSLRNAYQKSKWEIGDVNDIQGHKISEAVLENKAKVMLKNLVTRYSIAKAEGYQLNHNHDTHEHNPWPYNKHPEQGWVYTEGDFAPYTNIDLFTIFSQADPQILLKDSALCNDLIRGFRKKGSIKDPIGNLSEQEFNEAPIMVMNNAIVREIQNPDKWAQLSSIDLSTVFGNLDWTKMDEIKTMDKQKFREKVQEVLRDHPHQYTFREMEGYHKALYELFDRMRTLYMDTASHFHSKLREGQVIVVNTIVDRDRKPRILVPIVV